MQGAGGEVAVAAVPLKFHSRKARLQPVRLEASQSRQ